MTKRYILGQQMSSKVYSQHTNSKIMPYNETTVVIGGLMHIPVIIIFLKFIENRFNKNGGNYQGN